MSVLERLNVGIVGAAGRGGGFRNGLEANGARILAVCDIRKDKLDECAAALGADEKYVDYTEMLEKSDLNAIVVGTPMHLHVPQSVMALERNLHVLSEVPAAVSVEECKALVAAAAKSRAVYMMAENSAYRKPNVIVRELARQGLFGDLYYAEGEYLHELKQLNEITKWRRKWQTGIDGVTYGTHSLGPILQWMAGDRVVRVSCEGSGHHYTDPRGEPYCQDTSVMLCKTGKDALIKIRVDMVSDRPHAMTNYQLQGTDGVYESSRNGPVDRPRIWLRTLSEKPQWFDLDALPEKYLPEMWRNPPKEALEAGHGGGDFFEVFDFINAITAKTACPIGIHEAMDMTLPGLVSQQSVAQGGAWLSVPDSRKWAAGEPQEQLQMIWPQRLLESPPTPAVPDGYRLRSFRAEDKAAYLQVMAKAGFEGWDDDHLRKALDKVLPDGFFVVEHSATGMVVATAMALHNHTTDHPFGGEMGWVAADPAHRAKGLGRVVSAAVTARLLRAGYRDIYLRTDDFRLAAIKTYLRLGYEPLANTDTMERWNKVYQQLGLKVPKGGFRQTLESAGNHGTV